MPQPALFGTYPIPGIPGATLTAGYREGLEKVTQWFRNGPVPLVVDIETRGLGADALWLKCVTFGFRDEAVILDPREQPDAHLTRWAVDNASALIGHKLNFDLPNMALNRNCGGPLVLHRHVDKSVDTVLLKRLAHPGDRKLKDLDALAAHYLGMESRPILALFKALGYKSKKEGFLNLDIDSAAYLFGAASDVIATGRLLPILYAAAVDRQLNHPFQHGLSRYEAEQMIAERQEHNRWAIESQIHGLRCDFDYLEQYRARNQQRREQGASLLQSWGIDPGNGNHLTNKLHQLGALPLDHRLTDTGKWGAAAADLENLTHPLAKVFGQVKEHDHLEQYMQKCVDMSDDAGRIHPGTDVLKAAHGRDAMADPPLHQFPEDARGIILFDTVGTSIDYAQQEPRIAMNLAGDIGPALLNYEQFGTKIYKGIAEYAEISMAVAKIVVLAGLYGRGLAAMSAQLGLPPDPWIEAYTTRWGKEVEAHYGFQAAKDVMAEVFSAIPMTESLMNRGKQIARDHGLTYTVAGRIVPIPSGFYKGKFSVQAHKWINYHVSGSANDEISGVIVRARRAGMGQAVRFGMHDELLTETGVSRDIQRMMQQPSERFCQLSKRVPVIRTDIKDLGERWAAA